VVRLLIRLIRPDAGTVVLDGDPVDEPHGISLRELPAHVS
jgi:peptide/nickel transport system ATP-binding protein